MILVDFGSHLFCLALDTQNIKCLPICTKGMHMTAFNLELTMGSYHHQELF